MQSNMKKEALEYHARARRGKVEVIPTKPYSTQRDLSLAYSPGVAEPCKAIAENPQDVYKYTAKGNLVAVISNGTAVLGLGDIGPEASKPVMEGKGVLFKVFADIDVFDIEVDASDVDQFVATVKAIAPTFGGINLEDIKAPEAFEIERRLKEELDIPLMHDDQHGTAIISAAALLNALKLADKRIEDIRVVVSGAGAAAMSCLDIYEQLGMKREHAAVFDSKGHIHSGREGLDKSKQKYATATHFESLGAAMEERGRIPWAQQGRSGGRRDGEIHGEQPHRFCTRESRSGNRLRRSHGRTSRRDHGDGAERPPQPGQQRAGIPVHLPRRA